MPVDIPANVFYDLPTVKISTPRWFPPLFALLLPFFIGGCGRSSGPNEKIDVQAQIQNLKSADADARANACVELAKAGPGAAGAVQPLIESLKDSDPLVRRLSAYVLGEIGPAAKDAIPVLKTMLTEPDRQLIAAVVIAIRAIDPNNNKDLQPPLNVTK